MGVPKDKRKKGNGSLLRLLGLSTILSGVSKKKQRPKRIRTRRVSFARAGNDLLARSAVSVPDWLHPYTLMTAAGAAVAPEVVAPR